MLISTFWSNSFGLVAVRGCISSSKRSKPPMILRNALLAQKKSCLETVFDDPLCPLAILARYQGSDCEKAWSLAPCTR